MKSTSNFDNAEVRLNPKQIQRAVVRPGEAVLSAQMIQRVAHQLDQKCRDVEL
jgi:hypothetical protein